MTAMFRPPIAVSKAIGWQQVFGFDQADDAFFARVRAAQLAELYRYVPFNVVLIGINLLAVGISVRELGDAGFLGGWGLAVTCLAAVWLLRWNDARRNGDPLTVTRRQFWLVSAEVAVFGVCWAAMIAHLLPAAQFDHQAVLLLLSLTVMGACGFAAAVAPVCAVALVGIVALSTLLALPSGSVLLSPMVVLGFVSFAVLIIRGVIVTSFAMMARMRTQSELNARTAIVGLLLTELESNGSDWLIEVDADGRLTHVSPRMADVAGRSRDALIGEPLLSIVGDRRSSQGRTAVRALTERFLAQRPFRDAVVPARVDDDLRWWSLSGTPKYDVHGCFAGYRGVGKDITEVRRGQDRIAELARFDPLTGLANRALFREKLDDALARATRTGRPCALLFIDLDRFKGVNDHLGHHAGDRLLREAATRLRQAAGTGASIGRLGGDEFAVMIPGASPRRAEAVSRAIVAALARPFELDGVPATIGASVGFALGPQDGASTEALLRAADLALYEVKASGRGAACRFVPAIGVKVEERRALEADVRKALERGELALAFQPVVEASDEHIVGFEALLRWTHPRLGNIPPAKFIPVAEEIGAIIPIGHWVIREACRWASGWPRHIRIAVNLSPAQFDDPLLVATVQQALADFDIEPERLELEITESLFLNEKATTIERLAALKALGIRFALDDFGTGYSSLGYLHKASFSRIKIDRSFVSRLSQADGEATAIVQAIVSLANSLDMATTAEGTETRAEFEAVRALGCAQVQGYYFGRPMPPEQATALVGERVLEGAE